MIFMVSITVGPCHGMALQPTCFNNCKYTPWRVLTSNLVSDRLLRKPRIKRVKCEMRNLKSEI
jgi:hypothetical protein